MELALLDSGRKANSPKSRPMRCSAYAQARELQELLMGKARDPEVKGAVLSGISRAFKELEELKLRLRMKPAPKAVDVTKLAPRTRKSRDPGFAEGPPKGH
jgi:hypothetical protein